MYHVDNKGCCLRNNGTQTIPAGLFFTTFSPPSQNHLKYTSRESSVTTYLTGHKSHTQHNNNRIGGPLNEDVKMFFLFISYSLFFFIHIASAHY